MAYIEPNSTIKLLRNCPLDNTYDHTIYFSSRTAQTNYFESLTKYSYLDYSYVRKNRVLKVQAPAGSNLYDCNYLMFKNTSFENKWFYAFINSVEYDNNLTWLIEFEIDVMQTWMFDYTLEQCFAEREHSATDEIGDNLVPENLELGDYVSEGITRCHDGEGSSTASLLQDLSLVIGCTFNDDMTDYSGGYYNGLYSGLRYKVFNFPEPATTGNIQSFVSSVRQWIDSATTGGKSNGIVTAFVMPTAFISSDTSTSKVLSFYKNKAYTDIDGYVPKNKKLFTYPYNFLYCTNFQGQSCAYPYEYFRSPEGTVHCSFRLEADYSPDCNVVLSPINYKYVGGGIANYDEKMVLGGYPQLPFATDVWKAWCAMGAGSTIVNAIGSIAGYAGGAALAGSVVPGIGTATGALVGAGVGIGKTVLSSLETARENYIEPAQSHSGAGSTTMASIRLLDFGFMNKHIRAEFARIIDDYFNMFGYATKRCKVPNRNVRPHWTYTKTIGCCIVGHVPADDMKKICSIYNSGITFWRNGSEVGNYSLDNRPA